MPIKKIVDFSDYKQVYSNCKDPDHNPPSYISLEPGVYEHTCPSCYVTSIINVPLNPSL